jgi:sister chromatid cohesion protein DCC1
VLCTPDKTYALRSVVLSNSVLVVTPERSSGAVVVHDQLSEILEPVPVPPKLHKLRTLTHGMQYDDGSDVSENHAVTNPPPPLSSSVSE